MNDQKLNQLFAAARREAPAVPPAGFEWQVQQALRREPLATESAGVLEQLSRLFPRLAFASAAVMVLCVTGDWVLQSPGLTEGVTQLARQWLLF